MPNDREYNREEMMEELSSIAVSNVWVDEARELNNDIDYFTFDVNCRPQRASIHWHHEPEKPEDKWRNYNLRNQNSENEASGVDIYLNTVGNDDDYIPNTIDGGIINGYIDYGAEIREHASRYQRYRLEDDGTMTFIGYEDDED